MLDNYKIGQVNIYNLFVNAVKNNKLAHAYLIDSNNNSNGLDIILSIAKMLVCPNNYTNNDKCKNCNICQRIDNNNFLEIKIIKPDGNSIKKEQIIELQEDFSKLSVECNKKIYIILESEKMTDSTSNSILKFLEEPHENIIAFLITSNISKILPTIKSRCQLLKLQKQYNNYITTEEKIADVISSSKNQFDELVNSNKIKELLTETIKYIKYYEENSYSTIIYNEKILNLKNKTKEDVLIMFDIMINFYYDCLLKKNIGRIDIFNNYVDDINIINKKNSFNDILNKLEILLNYKELIYNNLNVNLLFDDMIIKLEGEFVWV